MAEGEHIPMSSLEPAGARSVAIDPALGEILRDQTLLVLALVSGEFEDARNLPPAELLALILEGGSIGAASNQSWM